MAPGNVLSSSWIPGVSGDRSRRSPGLVGEPHRPHGLRGSKARGLHRPPGHAAPKPGARRREGPGLGGEKAQGAGR